VPDATSALIEAYLAKRTELVRFFTLRLRSAEAAEDLVQDIYVRLTDAAPPPVSNPGAFLYRLGWNLMLDRLRSQRRSATSGRDWSAAAAARVTPATRLRRKTRSPRAKGWGGW
jgi:RNA polymerase sigma-70 factor (ECF subfamily)